MILSHDTHFRILCCTRLLILFLYFGFVRYPARFFRYFSLKYESLNNKEFDNGLRTQKEPDVLIIIIFIIDDHFENLTEKHCIKLR